MPGGQSDNHLVRARPPSLEFASPRVFVRSSSDRSLPVSSWSVEPKLGSLYLSVLYAISKSIPSGLCGLIH